MIDHSQMKLGRKAVKMSPVHRMASVALMDMLPAPPAAIDNRRGVTEWGMMLNDRLGDCTCAGLGHSLQVVTLNTGSMVTPPDSVIEQAYEKFCGYVPGDRSTDEGGVEEDVLSDAESQGFYGHQLLGRVSIDPANLTHVKQAVASFGAIYVGAQMPLAAQSGGLWKATSGAAGLPGGWGGHCMDSAAYSADLIPFITWGKNQDAAWDWWLKYVDEAHVLCWDVWLAKFPQATKEKVLAILQSLA